MVDIGDTIGIGINEIVLPILLLVSVLVKIWYQCSISVSIGKS